MRTEKQKEASRRNGAKSRGPVTPEGKQKSSVNALRHGLLAANVLVYGECPVIFANVLNEHIRKFQPADDIEHSMIEEMVASHWRLRRLWHIESRLLNESIEHHEGVPPHDQIPMAFCELGGDRRLRALDRYESRLHRMYQRSFQNFLKFREFQQDNTLAPVEIPPEYVPQVPEKLNDQTNPSPTPPEAPESSQNPATAPQKAATPAKTARPRTPNQPPAEEPVLDFSKWVDERPYIPPIYLTEG